MTDATEYTDGITGALIVHPTAPNPSTLPTWDAEIVIQVRDKPCNQALLTGTLDGRPLPQCEPGPTDSVSFGALT